MRTYGSAAETAKNANQHRYLFLLEIETHSGTHYYVRARSNVSFDGHTYLKKSFLFSESVHDVSMEMGQTEITVANLENALGAATITHDLRGRAVRLKQIFVDGTGAPIGTGDDYNDLLFGTVEDVKLMKPVAILNVRLMSRLDRLVPQMTYGSQCRWVFAGTGCGAADGEVTAQTCDSGTTATVIADAARAEAADYWKDGYVTMTSGDLAGESERVLSSATGTVTLEHSLSAAPDAGDTYTITRGCDRTYETCDDRYSNTANFGGFVNYSKDIIWE